MSVRVVLMALTIGVFCCPVFAQQGAIPPQMQQQLQELQNMSPKEREATMQELTRNMQAVQQCLEEAGGEQALAELKEMGEAHKAQIDALCKDGKPDQALAYAQDAATEMMRDPRISKLQQCSKKTLKNMPQFAALTNPRVMLDENNKNICN